MIGCLRGRARVVVLLALGIALLGAPSAAAAGNAHGAGGGNQHDAGARRHVRPAGADALQPKFLMMALPDVTCDPQPRPDGMAHALMNDHYRLAVHPTVQLPHRPTWREDPLHDRNWVLQYQTLWYVLALTQAWRQSGDQDDLDRAQFLVKSWIDHNPMRHPTSEFSWQRQVTGIRSIVLACLAEIVPDTPWLQTALTQHAKLLAKASFYSGRGNYALDQSLGLLKIGCVRGNRSWMSLAASRINHLIGDSIDSQGVPNEQAIAYSFYDYVRYDYAREMLRDCGQPVSSTFSRLSREPKFLAHATQPDGRYQMIGDSFDAHATSVPGTIAEFAATEGANGPKPAKDIAVYAAGYAFARTGWGEDRAYEDEMALALRFGPGKDFHAHDDGGSLTLYGFGSRLLLDPGFNAYENDSWRRYFQSREAHNAVVLEKAASDASARTVLARTHRDTTSFEALMRIRAYAGVSDTRRVIFSRRLGYLVVEDRLSSSRTHTYSQLWHLREDARPTTHGDATWTRRARGNVLIQQLIHRGTTRIERGHVHPLQGWVSYDYGVHRAAPVVEQRVKAASTRYLTLVVPFTSGTPPVTVSGLQVGSRGFSMRVSVRGQQQQVTATAKGATIHDVP